MQRFLMVFLTFMLFSGVGQVFGASDPPAPSSGAPDKKPVQGNSAAKANRGLDKGIGYGTVTGLEVGGSTKGASSVSVSPGAAVSSDGRSVSQGRQQVPDPRAKR